MHKKRANPAARSLRPKTRLSPWREPQSEEPYSRVCVGL
jgi:hypothetical protein